MKIKSVQIQAFKSYLSKADGSFDFTFSGKDSVANFVSLYAPNGFGKTSFFDAVDFAITGKISRYSRNKIIAKQNIEDIKGNNEQGKKQYLLRNKDAGDDDIKTEIEVFTTKRSEPFQSNYIPPRNRAADYKFPLEANDGTSFFEKTMLSQEAIDAFLRETNSEERYKKFASSIGGLDEIDENRDSIIAVKNEVEADAKLLAAKSAQLKIDIKNLSLLKNPTEEANNLITRLNTHEKITTVEFPPLKLQYTSLDHAEFSTKLEVFNSSMDEQIRVNKEQTQLFTDQLTDLATTRSLVEKLYELNKQLNSIRNLTVKKQTLIKLESNLTEAKKRKGLLLTEHESVEAFLKDLSAYKSHTTSIATLKSELNELKAKIEQTTLKLEQTKRNTQTKSAELEKTQQKIDSIRELIYELPEKFKQLTSLGSEIDAFHKSIVKLEQESLSLDPLIQRLESQSTLIKQIEITSSYNIEQIDAIKKEVVTALEIAQITYHKQVQLNKTIESDLKGIAVNLENTQSQSESIRDLIALATDVIAHTKQSNCPLCQHQYMDLQALQYQISSNPLLSAVEKSLTEKYQQLRKQHSDTLELQSSAQKQFCLHKLKIEDFINLKLGKVLNEKRALNAKLKLSKQGLEPKRTQRSELIAKLMYKRQDEYEVYLRGQSESFKKLFNKTKETLQSIELKKEEYSQNLQILNGKHQQKTNEFQLLEQSDRFKSITTYLIDNKCNLNLETIEIELFLKNKIQGLMNEIKESRTKLDEDSKKVAQIKTSLTTSELELSLEDISEKKRNAELSISEIKPKLTAFDRSIEMFGIEQPLEAVDWLNFETIARDKIHKLNSEGMVLVSAVKDSALLKTLTEKALEFRDALDLKVQLEKLESEERAYKRIGDDLSKDIETLNSQIQAHADIYFKTKLINELYLAIDPHPEFKEIEFKCITDAKKKPRLVINAIDPFTNNKVTPNLSFSSAQINVLALSIFLARALNVQDDDGEKVDCIFIDDPVQSIDSINTLSFIDLIRALCIRFDKQIIISTHDQNFHELLKKKIPPSVFPAKYLRLASFGLVVDDND